MQSRMELLLQRHLKQARLQVEQRERGGRLRKRWKAYALPVQAELHLHLERFGLDAAEHMTVILERFSYPMKAPREEKDAPSDH